MDTLETRTSRFADASREAQRFGLVVVYAADAPHLEGAWIPTMGRGETVVFGRGGKTPDDAFPRVFPRHEGFAREHELDDPYVSQVQLEIAATDDGVELRQLGRRPLLDGKGHPQDRVRLAVGDVAELKGRLLLMASLRSGAAPKPASSPPRKTFGSADLDGLVGGGPAITRLREAIAFVAPRAAHVLVRGETGTGKELVARAIHRQSAQSRQRLVSRNAATLPEGLIDAELFGHAANYPNAGMPERSGLIAEADGSTLFLDEIGELPHALSAKLLRVLDEAGEYQRLGEPRLRTSKLRLVAATNRELSELKDDLAARCRLRILVPPLRERREDIPLLARALLRRVAAQDPSIGARFFDDWSGRTGEPRIAIDLMKRLVLHDYRANVRELDLVLWTALGSSPGESLALTTEVEELLDVREEERLSIADPSSLSESDVRSALERAGGVHEKAWRELGLANRYVLRRLLKRFGI